VTVNEFVEFYKSLMKLFPKQMSDDQDTLDTWYGHLNDIPISLAENALTALADDPRYDPKWPPSALLIRRKAKQLSGNLSFDLLEVTDEDERDILRATYFELLEKSYHGEYDAEEWKHLASEFRHQNRLAGADHIIEVMERIEVDDNT
jgi:hypothetical protein